MELDENARALRDIHPEKLIMARKKLYRFLSEWLGGPKLFGEQYLTVEWLELRHRRFGPTQEHGEQWLYCMDTAMTNLQFDSNVKNLLNSRFSEMIDAMHRQRELITDREV